MTVKELGYDKNIAVKVLIFIFFKVKGRIYVGFSF